MPRRVVEDDEEWGIGWLQYQRCELWFGGAGVRNIQRRAVSQGRDYLHCLWTGLRRQEYPLWKPL